MQITYEGKTYSVNAYDVIQIASGSGQHRAWGDYETLRTESEMRTALGMAIRHPNMYRVVTSDKRTVICPK